MRFSSYLILEGGRSKVLKIEDWISIARKKHKKTFIKFTSTGNALWRGHTSLSTDDMFGYVDPKKGRARKSAHTTNYYTMWIDNSPKWKAYPKRSRSLVCGNWRTAAYGPVNQRFIILPEDNANIGVCDADDFWYSFQKTSPFRGDLSDFNDSFWNMYQTMFKKELSGNLSWNELQAAIHRIDDNTDMLDDKSYNTLEVAMKKSNKTLWEIFDETFDPQGNDFQLIKSTDKIPQDGDRECWTDGKSLMLNSEVMGMDEWEDIKNSVIR